MHYYRKLKAKSMPRDIITVDTESQGGDPTMERSSSQSLVLGVAIHRHYYKDRKGKERHTDKSFRFTQADQFWRWLHDTTQKRKKRFQVWAHNCSFDMALLDPYSHIGKYGMVIERQVIAPVPFMMTIKGKISRFEILDTLNLWRISLDGLAKTLQLDEKLLMPESSDREALWDYCYRDCAILQQALAIWRSFLVENNLGRFSKTLASQAMTTYRYRFMPDIKIARSLNPHMVKREREGYLGGRTECFYIGKLERRIHCVDINSMYASVLRANHFPRLPFKYLRKPFSHSLLTRYEDRLGWIYADIEIKTPCMPIRHNDRLVFPVGRVSGVFYAPEWRAFKELITVHKIREAGFYSFSPLFREYIDTLYALRLKYRDQGNLAFAYACKTLMNSLYGKFGQRTENWKDDGETLETEGSVFFENSDYGAVPYPVRVINGRRMVSLPRKEHKMSIPVIAGYTTSLARVLLWRYMHLAGERNVFYCDTDSLFVNDKGLLNLRPHIDDSRLGKLKLEWTTKDLEIHGAKNYRIGDKRKIKGIKHNAEEISAGVFRQVQFQGWIQHIMNGERGVVDVKLIQKELSGDYFKGKVTDKGEVIPYRINHY